MSALQRNRLGKSFLLLTICFVIASVIEPSSATLDLTCKSGPCLKGTACEKSPCMKGSCYINGTDFLCLCPPGYTGKTCQQTMCNAYPCKKGTCINLGIPFIRTCMCSLPIVGKFSQCNTDTDIDAPCCEQSLCLNGGTCKQLKDSAMCSCPNGYSGTDCSTKTAAVASSASASNNNIDNCASSPCAHGTCVNSGTSYLCTCDAGWTGQNCDQATAANIPVNKVVSSCASNPCVHGSCASSGSSYQCNCTAGWMGQNCDQVDYCASNPCTNGACANTNSGFVCTCNQNWTGSQCNTYNGCASNPCQNGGTCTVPSGGGWSCQCVPPWQYATCNMKLGDF